MNKRTELTELIKAGFSCFYIFTEDENYVIKEIKKIAEELSFTYNNWSLVNDDLEDFIRSRTESDFNFVLNSHFFLESPGVIQAFKDMIPKWKGTGCKLFLIENVKKIPLELDKNVTYFEFDLPGKDVIEDKLNLIYESVKDNGLDLSTELEDSNYKSSLIDAALGLTSQQAEDAFSLSIVRSKRFDPKIVTRVKANEYLKSGIMELEEPEDVSSFQGYDNLMEYIYSIKDSFFNESRFKLPAPKGIILVGIPGTGKTLASKVIASIFNLMLLKVDLGKVFSEYVGSSESNMRQLISVAESIAPVVMRIDEIEKQMGGMSESRGDSGVGLRVLAPLLTWLQERKRPIFIVATANDISGLRPEILRKGRFDEIFFLDLPDDEERISIFDHHLTKRIPQFNWTQQINYSDSYQVIKFTKGWSGAEIEQVIIQALRKFDNKFVTLYPVDILRTLFEEIRKTVPLSVIRKEDINSLRTWAVENNARLASENRNIEEEQKRNRLLLVD